MEDKYLHYAKRFKALSDSNRLWILEILIQGEHCACKLLELLDVSQSTLSHHMKILTEASLVTVRKDGKWAHYSLSKEGLEELKNYLSHLK